MHFLSIIKYLNIFFTVVVCHCETNDVVLQGSGLGFRVIRMGYDDIYLCSPGSFSRRYGKDYFICTGPASMPVYPLLVGIASNISFENLLGAHDAHHCTLYSFPYPSFG